MRPFWRAALGSLTMAMAMAMAAAGCAPGTTPSVRVGEGRSSDPSIPVDKTDYARCGRPAPEPPALIGEWQSFGVDPNEVEFEMSIIIGAKSTTLIRRCWKGEDVAVARLDLASEIGSGTLTVRETSKNIGQTGEIVCSVQMTKATFGVAFAGDCLVLSGTASSKRWVRKR